MKNRSSSYDLMKIVSMFLIVVCHVINHGQVLKNIENPTLNLLVQLIFLFTLVHVNSFILVTGYFQCDKSFKSSKVWGLINASMFYKIIIMIIFGVFWGLEMSSLQIFRELFPFNLDEYWFIKLYIILYCLTPFLNIIIKNMNQRKHQKLLLILFFFFSILPYITGNESFSNTGYSLSHFVFLYLIGSYLRKYPIKKSFIGEKMSNSLFQLFCILFFCFGWLGNFCVHTTASSFLNTHSIVNEISNNLIKMNQAYSNPFVMIQSISYFLFFGTLSLNNSWISKISNKMMGVYLIHEHSFVRNRLYFAAGILKAHIVSSKFLFKIFLVSIIVFIFCLIIETLRQIIFKFVYRRKISKRIRNYYHRWIHSFEFY